VFEPREMSSDIALRDDELSGKLTDLQVELARLKKYASDDDVEESVRLRSLHAWRICSLRVCTLVFCGCGHIICRESAVQCNPSFVYIQVVQELDDEFKACSALLDDMKSEFKWVPTDEKGIWREVCVRGRWPMLASSACCTCALLGSRFD